MTDASELDAFNQFISLTTDPAVLLDSKGVILKSNSHFNEILRSVGKKSTTIEDFFSGAPLRTRVLNNSVLDLKVPVRTNEICQYQGKTRSFLVTRSWVALPKQQNGILCTFKDNTSAFSENEKLTRIMKLIETSNNLIATFSLDGKLKYANEDGLNYFKFSHTEDLLFNFSVDSQKEQILNAFQSAAISGKKWEGEVDLKCTDSLNRYGLARIIPLTDPTNENEIESVGITISDITALKLSQQSLMKKSKMQSLGVMAGGIAHEINTPLTTLMVSAQWVESQLEEENPDFTKIKSSLQKSVRVLDFVAKIVSTLRVYASSEVTQGSVQKVSLKSQISLFSGLSSERLRANGFRVDIPQVPENIFVEIGESELQQVLLNLATNSLEANHENKNPWFAITVEAKKNGFVEISVKDSGPGIPPDLRQKIFDPFFTTKDVGSMGLGLSLSVGIIQGRQGDLVYDETSPNTCFKIVLPYTSS
jgi:signal transduction histidine kinase